MHEKHGAQSKHSENLPAALVTSPSTSESTKIFKCKRGIKISLENTIKSHWKFKGLALSSAQGVSNYTKPNPIPLVFLQTAVN